MRKSKTAHTIDGTSVKLVASARSYGLSRLPWRCRTKITSRTVKTPAQRRNEKAARDQRRTALQLALREARTEVHTLAEGLHTRFPTYSAAWFERTIIQSSTKRRQRKILSWNVFVSRRARELNDEREHAGSAALKPPDLAGLLSSEWSQMSEAEKQPYHDGVVELEDRNDMKALAVQNVSINAFQDARQTIAQVRKMLSEMKARTGVESTVFAVRSKLDDYLRPIQILSSTTLNGFWELCIGKSVEEIGNRMEAYAVGGLENVLNKYARDITSLRAQVSDLVLRKLQEACYPDPAKQMDYKSFGHRYTDPYGIVIRNWPLAEFRPPYLITKRVELETLMVALLRTKIFDRLTKEEHTAYKARLPSAPPCITWATTNGETTRGLLPSAPDDLPEPELGGNATFGISGLDTDPPMQPSGSAPAPTMQPSGPTPAPTPAFTSMTLDLNKKMGEAKKRKKRSDAGKPRGQNSQVGNITGQRQWAESGRREHANGEAEVNAAKVKGYTEGTKNRFGGWKDSVFGAISGNKSKQSSGNVRKEKGERKQEFNRA
ncbi:hypothetical protein CYLTODRAFT_492889 [Cylindrobasidium torrendii FP15055 ss-10]|uniref:Uncharacterized protein n=1 Tax=Cylindrobasidium torrendii FP15055 ss-10 TaxID=1314674 RepID=A0A0D7B3H4_9AGAR|nr:hypothetical protein CYLTODRAFT_492889 [Cylindrobasidium torrendii FP15055 ss-10]